MGETDIRGLLESVQELIADEPDFKSESFRNSAAELMVARLLAYDSELASVEDTDMVREIRWDIKLRIRELKGASK